MDQCQNRIGKDRRSTQEVIYLSRANNDENKMYRKIYLISLEGIHKSRNITAVTSKKERNLNIKFTKHLFFYYQYCQQQTFNIDVTLRFIIAFISCCHVSLSLFI